MSEQIPNSNGEGSQGNEAKKPVLGTTPTSQQVKNDPPTTEKTTEGTEAEQKPNPTAKKEGEGDDQEIDYKVKFSESSKEAQRLLAHLKAAGIDPETGKPIEAPAGEQPTTEAPTGEVEEPARAEAPIAEDIKPLTDEELAKTIPGFANLDENTKAIMRDVKSAYSMITAMSKVLSEIVDERQFGKDMKQLTSKEEWKKIAEFSDEFQEFAYKKENLKVPLETLAASFLYQKGASNEKKSPPKPAPTGLEPGGGGKGEEKGTKAEGYTAEEAAKIRKTDPKKYVQLVREGKLKIRKE